MALTVTVTRGFTFTSGVPFTNADLNAAALPSISLNGVLDSSNLEDGSVTYEKTVPGPHFYQSATTTFGSGTYAITLAPALASYVAGAIVRFTVPSTNTGAVDVNVNGLGAVNLYKNFITTENETQELEAGDLRAGDIAEIICDGTDWLLFSSQRKTRSVHGTPSSGANAFVIDVSNPPYQYHAGLRASFVADFTITGAPTLEISDVETTPDGADAIKWADGTALTAGDIVSGQVVEVMHDGTDWIMISPHRQPAAAPVVASARGLVVKRVTAGTVDIDADQIVVRASGGQTQLLTSVDLTLDLSNSGANGRDAGSEASGTWYYIYVIWNGTTTAGLFSTSKTSPTLPSGYTHKALVGVCRNDGSSDIIEFYQAGERVWIVATELFDDVSPTSANTYQAYTTGGTTDMADIIPDIAVAMTGTMGCADTAGTEDDGRMAVAGSSSGIGEQIIVGYKDPPDFADFGVACPYVDVPLVTAQTIYWKHRTNSSAGARLTVSGYLLNLNA